MSCANPAEFDDHAAYRQALSGMAASVAVITVQDRWRARAVTVSSLVSVSLAPKLLSFCLSAHGKTHGLLSIGTDVGISVLSASQVHLARRYSVGGRGSPSFRDEADARDWNGVWVFAGSSAWFAATVENIIRLGDHYLYVLRVGDAASFPRDVLTYFGRDYGTTRRLLPEPPAALELGPRGAA